MNLKFMRRVSERERAIRQFVIVKKQIAVSFLRACPVIDNEFLHNIVKVVWGPTRPSPRGCTATLTMLWRNSWSITGQTYKKTDINLLNINRSRRFFFNIFEAWLLSTHAVGEWIFHPFGSYHSKSRIFERIKNFHNDSCHLWTKNLLKNSCSRQLRIVNAVVTLIASRSDGLTEICFSPD